MKYTFYSVDTLNNQNDLVNEYKDCLNNENWIYDEINPDIVFSFGGDGTMLGAVRKYLYLIDKVKFIGIKTGSLGFFYSFEPNDIHKIIKAIENNQYKYLKYDLLEYHLIGDTIVNGYALNEITIINPLHLVVIDVFINDLNLETMRGTGFIVCTPAGSTAYSKSAGGSVIDPTLEAFQLTEIASLNNRVYKTISSPLVFSKKTKVELEFKNNKGLYIAQDGNELKCDNLKKIEVVLSDKYANMIVIDDDFWARVKRAFIE